VIFDHVADAGGGFRKFATRSLVPRMIQGRRRPSAQILNLPVISVDRGCQFPPAQMTTACRLVEASSEAAETGGASSCARLRLFAVSRCHAEASRFGRGPTTRFSTISPIWFEVQR